MIYTIGVTTVVRDSQTLLSDGSTATARGAFAAINSVNDSSVLSASVQLTFTAGMSQIWCGVWLKVKPMYPALSKRRLLLTKIFTTSHYVNHGFWGVPSPSRGRARVWGEGLHAEDKLIGEPPVIRPGQLKRGVGGETAGARSDLRLPSPHRRHGRRHDLRSHAHASRDADAGGGHSHAF